MMRADGGSLFGLDLLVVAALHRSLELADGFSLLVRSGNATAAIPLLRLQVDTVLRLWACWLVHWPHELAVTMMDDVDGPLAKCGIKTRDGQLLHDRVLYESAAVHFPGIAVAYRASSAFVHLSHRAFAQSTVGASESGARLGVGHRREWTESARTETIEAFNTASQSRLRLVIGFAHTKNLTPEALAAGRARQDPPLSGP